MLTIDLDELAGIATLIPEGELQKEDFELAAQRIDPYIEKHGRLRGIIIFVQSFPGWDSFAALSSHLHFVREHHKKIECVALVTDSPIAIVAENLATHFVRAEIKHFEFQQIEQARQWVLDNSDHDFSD